MTVENLSVDECLRRLRTVRLGRLAVIHDGRPNIFPVNFVVDHGTVVFRTGPGTKLSAVNRDQHVAFEADGHEDAKDGTSAWSVTLLGRAHVIRRIEDLIDTTTLELWPELAGPKPTFLRLEPDQVTGRRFPVTDPAGWQTARTGIGRIAPE